MEKQHEHLKIKCQKLWASLGHKLREIKIAGSIDVESTERYAVQRWRYIISRRVEGKLLHELGVVLKEMKKKESLGQS